MDKKAKPVSEQVFESFLETNEKMEKLKLDIDEEGITSEERDKREKEYCYTVNKVWENYHAKIVAKMSKIYTSLMSEQSKRYFSFVMMDEIYSFEEAYKRKQFRTKTRLLLECLRGALFALGEGCGKEKIYSRIKKLVGKDEDIDWLLYHIRTVIGYEAAYRKHNNITGVTGGSAD